MIIIYQNSFVIAKSYTRIHLIIICKYHHEFHYHNILYIIIGIVDVAFTCLLQKVKHVIVTSVTETLKVFTVGNVRFR